VWLWVQLGSPTVLAAGTYTIGAYYANGNDHARFSVNSYAMAPGVSYGQSRHGPGSGQPMQYVNGHYPGFFGPNLKFGEPVPEIPLVQLPVLVGLGGLAWFRRQRSR
jgi:hypothetical protein